MSATHDLATARWRIDDLAHETGLTVDTIRYYQRQGLLPPGEREGRHRIYGREHVERLRRIKELQARRFSIAAIHALVSGDGDRLAGVFADEGESLRLTLDEHDVGAEVGEDPPGDRGGLAREVDDPDPLQQRRAHDVPPDESVADAGVSVMPRLLRRRGRPRRG